MKHNLKKLVLAGALALGTAAAAPAQDSGPLIDALVRKGILNDQEAEEIRADLVKDFSTSSSAGKLNLSSSVTELKLSGDLRLRYQNDVRDQQQPSVDASNPNGGFANETQRSRFRFRLRLNADFKLGPDYFGGVQLQTSQTADSGNQTYENGFNNYDIFISRAYLGWNAADWLTVVAGKQANPFYTTDLVWDPDINPTGLSESVAIHKLFGWHRESSEGTAGKDGKGYVAPSSSRTWSDPGWELTLNLGQFIYDDNSESLFDNDASTDAFLIAGQLLGSAKIAGAKVTVAPGVMFFNAADTSGLINENSFSDVAGVSGETRNQVIVTAPGDIAFNVGELPVRFYWDAAYNTMGSSRFNKIYSSAAGAPPISGGHENSDDLAWLVGLQVGKNKAAGDWSANVNWRQTGISSIDPNLNDSDFALGELNTRGLKAGVAYTFTDFLVGGVNYLYAFNLRDDLIGGQATRGAAIADGNVIRVFQVDLSMKF